MPSDDCQCFKCMLIPKNDHECLWMAVAMTTVIGLTAFLLLMTRDAISMGGIFYKMISKKAL